MRTSFQILSALAVFMLVACGGGKKKLQQL